MNWPSITQGEVQNLKLVIEASPLAKQARFAELLKSLLEKLHQPLAVYIEKALGTKAGTLHESQGNYLQSGDISIQLKSEDTRTDSDACFDVLEKALLNRRAVRANYLPGGKTESVEHVLHPYASFSGNRIGILRRAPIYLRTHRSLSRSTAFKALH